jgi:hypothetical protein
MRLRQAAPCPLVFAPPALDLRSPTLDLRAKAAGRAMVQS